MKPQSKFTMMASFVGQWWLIYFMASFVVLKWFYQPAAAKLFCGRDWPAKSVSQES